MKLNKFEAELNKKLSTTDYNILMHFFTFKELIKNDELTKSGYKIIKKILKYDKPLPQIIGYRFFFENWFIINKKILIPRFESEILVEKILEENLEDKIIIDLCCGSGCLGISAFLKSKNCNLYLSDISRQAVKCTIKNLKAFKIKAEVFNGDFFKPFIKNKVIGDLIIINPPYISKGDSNLENLVIKNEPKLALYAKYNGLDFFYRIKKEYKLVLKNNGKIYCEFGFNQKHDIEKIFQNDNIKFYKDYSNNWRYFVLQNNG